MPLELTSPRMDALARQLAEATGEDIETAVERAVEERLARVARPLSPTKRAKVEAIVDRLVRLPILDPRAPDEIIGFDENGLPT